MLWREYDSLTVTLQGDLGVDRGCGKHSDIAGTSWMPAIRYVTTRSDIPRHGFMVVANHLRFSLPTPRLRRLATSALG